MVWQKLGLKFSALYGTLSQAEKIFYSFWGCRHGLDCEQLKNTAIKRAIHADPSKSLQIIQEVGQVEKNG